MRITSFSAIGRSVLRRGIVEGTLVVLNKDNGVKEVWRECESILRNANAVNYGGILYYHEKDITYAAR